MYGGDWTEEGEEYQICEFCGEHSSIDWRKRQEAGWCFVSIGSGDLTITGDSPLFGIHFCSADHLLVWLNQPHTQEEIGL